MSDKTNKFIYQIEGVDIHIDVQLKKGTVWMTQKAIAELYQTTPQNITLHLKDILKRLDGEICSRHFIVVKKEGYRKVQRRILHYNLDVIFNIAVKGQHFEKINKLISFAKKNGVSKEFLKILPIKERNFGEMLKASLEGITEIFMQHRVEGFIVDFYLPEISLVIEYDEKHHDKQIEEDRVRQKLIEKEMNVQFIRVNEGEELQGLNYIIKYLLKNGAGQRQADCNN